MKHLLLKTWLVMACLMLGVGTGWAEEADYTLTPTVGSNNTYTGNCDVTIGDITWNVEGNATMVPWRIGGKNITKTERWVYSKTAYTSAVSRVDLTVGAAANITVNSLKLVYSTNSDFSNSSEISKTFAASSTISFEGDFPANAYYKFVFNVTVSGNSNKFVEFSKVEFYNSGAADTRTAVNMTGFSAASTTLTKGNNTTTSVTNDQNEWNPAYTYESDNTSVATVNESGVITAVAKGTARITATLDIANNDANWKKGATSSMYVDITVNNPSHTAQFSINGSIDPANNSTVEEGEAITFPADPSEDGVVFKGWATAAIVGTQDAAPSFVNTATETMGTNDVTYYAVFATEEEGGTQWRKVAASAVNSAGVYAIITTDGHAFNGTISSGHGQLTSTAFSFDSKGVATSAPDGTCEITFTAVTGGYTMYNASNGYLYASAASSGKLAWHNTENSYWLYKSSNWLYNSNSAYLRDYQNSSIRTYGSNNGSVIQFAKKESSTTYSDYCTTVSLDPKPTIVLSATELAEYAGNTNTSITANVSEDAYTGALTVESSAEAVATASISEGTITINALTAGSATITVTAPEVTGFRKNTATIAVTVSNKLAHGLSFDAATLNLTVGDKEITEPTLSNPNSLPVVYSLEYATPANVGKVATIDPVTGKLTLADPSLSTETQGAVTVKAHTDGDNSHAAGDVTYNLVVARKVTTTSWSNGGAAVNIDQDEIATLPTASNDGDRNLFYESSNEDVAKFVDGVLTFVGYGTTTITAKTSATAEYAATSATYELTFAPRYTVTFKVYGQEDVELREETSGAGVTAPAVEPINGKVFRGWAEATIDGTTDDAPAFVSTTTLDGNKTLYAVFATVDEGENFELVENLANINEGEAYIGSYINYSGSRYYIATSATDMVNATVTNKILTIPSNALLLNFVSTGTANEFYIKDESGNYLNVTSSDWASFTSTACALTFSGSNPFVLKSSTGTNYLRAYGSSATAGKLKRYASQTNTGICVFQKSKEYSGYCTTVTAPVPTTATITLNAACTDGDYVYGTYSNTYAWVVPSNLEVSEVGVVDGKLVVSSYKTSDVVPANTGVMVSATEGGEYTVDIETDPETLALAESVLGEDNCLRPTGDGITDEAMAEADADCTYYRLTMHNGTQIGFWWGAADGAAFALAANKAYLAVPNSSDARVQSFWFGEETAIEAVKAEQNTGVRYNMAGQRVSAGYKGIVIVNGKKMLNK